MTKSPDAFKTISEVADELKLPQHVLRFWETRFSQIKPMKRGGGRRYYRPDDLSLLRGIRHLLYSEGYTIKGVQRILKEQGARHVATQWLDTGDDQVVATQPQGTAAVEPLEAVMPQNPAEAVAPAPIPIPPTAVMQPIAQTAEPLVSQPAPVPEEQPAAVAPPEVVQQPAQAAPQASMVAQAIPAAPVSAPAAQPAVSEPVAPQLTPQSSMVAPPTQAAEQQKQAVMPPFAITHGVPAHLVDAITPATTLIEPIAAQDDDGAGSRSADAVPADILSDGEKGGSIAKSIGMGLLGKITGNEDGDRQKQGQSILPRGDVERLQATLVDLLECKRLLDQIR